MTSAQRVPTDPARLAERARQRRLAAAGGAAIIAGGVTGGIVFSTRGPDVSLVHYSAMVPQAKSAPSVGFTAPLVPAPIVLPAAPALPPPLAAQSLQAHKGSAQPAQPAPAPVVAAAVPAAPPAVVAPPPAAAPAPVAAAPQPAPQPAKVKKAKPAPAPVTSAPPPAAQQPAAAQQPWWGGQSKWISDLRVSGRTWAGPVITRIRELKMERARFGVIGLAGSPRATNLLSALTDVITLRPPSVIGIGARGIPSGPLPHHPACGSAPGGSKS